MPSGFLFFIPMSRRLYTTGANKSSLGAILSFVGLNESLLGVIKSLLGTTESLLGATESSLGVTRFSLGVTRSSLGVTKSSLGVTISLKSSHPYSIFVGAEIKPSSSVNKASVRIIGKAFFLNIKIHPQHYIPSNIRNAVRFQSG
jgi:hypothetical protein